MGSRRGVNLDLQAIYNGFADTYEESRGLFDMSEVLESFYQRLGAEAGDLLDLGCGAGEPFGRYFVDRGWSVVGVDFSARMLELAARYVPEMQTIHSDMRTVEFEPAQFDAVTAVYSLFHVPAAEHPALFEKFRRWLRPGGKVLFTYATREYTGCDEFDGFKEFLGKQLYYSHRTPEHLVSDLEYAGLAVESLDYRDIGGEIFLWVTACRPL